MCSSVLLIKDGNVKRSLALSGTRCYVLLVAVAEENRIRCLPGHACIVVWLFRTTSSARRINLIGFGSNYFHSMDARRLKASICIWTHYAL